MPIAATAVHIGAALVLAPPRGIKALGVAAIASAGTRAALNAAHTVH